MVTRRGGRVYDLGLVRARRLAEELSPQLEREGQLAVAMTDLDDPAIWRRACRIAARRLGTRVQTGVTPNGIVWAVVDNCDRGDPDARVVIRALLDLPPR
jgi:hypothetical protein